MLVSCKAYLTVVFTFGLFPISFQSSPNRTNVDRKLAQICGAKTRVPKIKLRLNHEIFNVNINSSPTHVRLIRLYSRTGYLMEVWDRKRIRGTTHTTSNRTWFELQSYGRSIVRLRSKKTGRYLAINWRGRPTMQVHLTTDSLFRTKLEGNGFHSFASHKYYSRHRHDLFIGIKKNGSFKSPLSTLPGQKSVQFLVLYQL